jgi:hypothetical protein|tara:strand:+ start:487 stop:819 length:333 start_codon:yes stop_codon:yes gene_type:complete
MMDFVHHLVHFLLYSLIVWQIVLGCWIILIWTTKNFKFHRSPTFNIGESSQKGVSPIEETKVKKDLGPIEVDVKKNVIMDTKSDESSVKLDEKIKGKVKTQKDKLKKLRG